MFQVVSPNLTEYATFNDFCSLNCGLQCTVRVYDTLLAKQFTRTHPEKAHNL